MLLATMLPAAGWLAAGCGGAPNAFATSFRDNVETDVRALLNRVANAPKREEAPVAVGVTASPPGLYAFDLKSKKVMWQQPVETQVTPFIAGEFVVVQEKAGIVVRGIGDGQRRAVVPDQGMSLRGADGQGPLVAITMARGSGRFSSSRVVAVRNGSVAWSHEFDGAAGVPAVAGDAVVVPWNHQYLSALDGKEGYEFARIRVVDTVVGHAFLDRGNLFAGSNQGIFLVTPALAAGSARNRSFYALPSREIPGRPELLPDMYAPNPVPAPQSARHYIKLGWLPAVASQDRIALEGDVLYLQFYRFIMAFEPESFAVRWVYTHPNDLVGVQVLPEGVVFADREGNLGYLSAASGRVLWEAKSGRQSLAVQLRAGAVPLAADTTKPPTPRELTNQLLSAAQHPDARLVPIRILAVEFLAAMDDPSTTASLIDLCDNRRNTPPVRKAACEALSDREIGSDAVLEALRQHAAFLEGTTAPPVGALAKAASRLNEPRAVGMLIAHLRDPNTTSRDLPALVISLKDLNDRAAVQPLTDFLRMYHADAMDEYMVEALGLTADALVALSGPAATDVLGEVADDEMGNESIRSSARSALQLLETQTAAAERIEAEEQEEQEREAAKAEERAVEEKKVVPPYLSGELLDKVLSPVSDELRACLRSAKDHPKTARVLMVVNAGSVESVHVVPTEIQSCVEPLVRSCEFPATRVGGRERVTYPIDLQR